jgi:hypothetical protein
VLRLRRGCFTPVEQGGLLIFGRVLALFALAIAAFAQYGGPAILSRGDAPTGMTSQPLGFVPDFEVSGVYDTGLAGTTLNAKGQLGNTSSEGVMISGGISGNHTWRHTQLGLNYHGSLNHFAQATYYDGSNQTLMLGITQQFTRHITAVFRESAYLLTTGVASTSLAEGVPYDPSQSIVPPTDFIDNRTTVLSTQASVVYKQSTRLSYDFSGQYYINRRAATDLAGVTGITATGDVQYRISLRSTIGADYSYSNFSYTRVFSASNTHSFHGSYSMTISKSLEFSAFGGVSRSESKSEELVAVDPLIAALLGITEGLSVSHVIRYSPSASGRISKTMQHGVVFATAAHTIVPGNGLFLTSNATVVSAGYGYTGLANWSINAGLNFTRATTLGITGNYGNTTGRISVSHKITKSLSIIGSVSGSQYESGTFSLYNHVIYNMNLGMGWSPGNVPLRLW